MFNPTKFLHHPQITIFLLGLGYVSEKGKRMPASILLNHWDETTGAGHIGSAGGRRQSLGISNHAVLVPRNPSEGIIRNQGHRVRQPTSGAHQRRHNRTGLSSRWGNRKTVKIRKVSKLIPKIIGTPRHLPKCGREFSRPPKTQKALNNQGFEIGGSVEIRTLG